MGRDLYSSRPPSSTGISEHRERLVEEFLLPAEVHWPKADATGPHRRVCVSFGLNGMPMGTMNADPYRPVKNDKYVARNDNSSPYRGPLSLGIISIRNMG